MNLPNTSRLEFDEKKHAYKLDGKLLSGVTTVISSTSAKDNLINWAANMAVDYLIENPGQYQEARTAHTRRKDKASQKGTDTHAVVEQYILRCIAGGGEPFIPMSDLDQATYVEILPFTGWAMANVSKFVAAEQRLYSEKYGYAGTCDFVALMGGKLTIGDLKTFPKMWSADAFIQMGAYSLAWRELTGESPEQSVVVKMCDPTDERLKKYGGKAFAVYPRYALEEDEDMFLTRLKMYRYNQNFVSPKE